MRRNKKILLVLLAGINVLSFVLINFSMTNVRPSKDQYQIYQMIIKSNVFIESTRLQDTSYSKNSENVRNLLRKETEIDGYYPVDGSNVCPYLGIRKIPYSKEKISISNSHCNLRVPSQDECKKAYESYRIGDKPEKCEEEQEEEELCYFTNAPTATPTEVRVKCNLNECGGNPVFVASIDPNNGELEDRTEWKQFFEVNDLEASLPLIMKENSANGFHFCFLSCLTATRKNTIRTLLMFPPRTLQRNEENSKLSNDLFNINVLVLDSVSRPHFYRSLPETVKTLRQISYNDSLESMVLDYELFQSLGPYTYINMKAFFTGNSLYHAEKRLLPNQEYQYYYGFDIFYKKLKEKGFYTLLQEDSCWHDVWGTILANTRKDLRKDRNAQERMERWRQLLEKTENSYIDDTGVSHATCSVLSQYKVTNQFAAKPTKVCYGRKVYFQYLLDYLDRLYQYDKIEESYNGKRTPIFSYTHFSIGHEYAGTRIRQADTGLSKYLRKLAEDQNTMTMIFSDHGPKTTHYAIHSKEGMYELYAPFLFLIIPEKIASIIGEKRVKNLIENQKRPITLKDVNRALNTILEYGRLDKLGKPFMREGIFSAIPESRRICSYDTLCICSGNEKWFPDNYVNFTWIAEFAIGELNNQIQRFHSKGIRSMSNTGGFGNCQRLVLKHFKKVRLTEDDRNFLVTINVITSPVNQEFQVIVKYPKIPASLSHRFKKKTLFARLVKFRRLTTYQDYYECKDRNVSIQLCVCKRINFQSAVERAKSTLWRWTIMNSPEAVHEVMRRQGSLGAKQEIQNLDGECLFLISRSYGNQTLAYEIANACRYRRYMVRVAGQSISKVLTSVSLPLTVDAKPLTLHFILTVYHYRKPFDFAPLITFHTE